MEYKEKIYSHSLSDLLTKNVLEIFDIIENAGYKARIVGGAVRNFLMNKPISDIDIATTASPEKIAEIFRKYDIEVIFSGIKYGTVTVLYKEKSYEITTLRRDIKTFGRKAEVSFTSSFEEDSNRRDFTINAIYLDKNGIIYDYHNGISDIRNKKVRFIGDPKERIKEDYLRIFRYFRFVAYYGNFQCDKEYLRIIYEMRECVKQLSSERIQTELLKILELDSAYKIIPDMLSVLNELFELQDIAITSSLEFFEKSGIKLSATKKLCLILKFSNINAKDLIKKYKFPKQIQKLLLVQTDIKSYNDNSNYDLNLCNPQKYCNSLKLLQKNERYFFINYVITQLYCFYYPEKISAEKLSTLRNKLIDFCNSEYADFNFRASDLSEYNLSKEKLEKVMMNTKKIWISSDKNLSAKDCKEIAETFIKTN